MISDRMPHLEPPGRGDSYASIRSARAHRCTEQCVCRHPFHEGEPAPLIYAPGPGLHACSSSLCPNAHGMETEMVENFAEARARHGFHPIKDAITCPNHPDICIGTEHWRTGWCGVCGTTCEEALLAREKLGGMTAERMAEAVALLMRPQHPVQTSWSAAATTERSWAYRLGLRLGLGVGRSLGHGIAWAIVAAAPIFERLSKTRKP